MFVSDSAFTCQGGIRVSGGSRVFTSLSEFVKAHATSSSDLPMGLVLSHSPSLEDIESPLVGKSDHVHASWFVKDRSSKEHVYAKLRNDPNGTFRVYADDELHVLAYAFNGAVLEEFIELSNEMAKLQRESTVFFSLSALIASHIYEQGVLRCLLLSDGTHLLIRSLNLNACGRSMVTARSRVDVTASSSAYYLGGVPEEVALDALDGAFDGAFVVRDSLSDMQLLWLHYVAQGRVQHLRIENTPSGLHFNTSTSIYGSLSQMIAEYVTNSDNDMELFLRLGWGIVVPVQAPPVGPYDHLTAPWFMESLTREEANEQLDYHPTGTFVCCMLLINSDSFQSVYLDCAQSVQQPRLVCTRLRF